jgi:hypothetical protein
VVAASILKLRFAPDFCADLIDPAPCSKLWHRVAEKTVPYATVVYGSPEDMDANGLVSEHTCANISWISPDERLPDRRFVIREADYFAFWIRSSRAQFRRESVLCVSIIQ